MPRPVLYVLAGVNGAGKSSVGGYLLSQNRLTWFNPDTFARELIASSGCDQLTANGHAWAEGMRRLTIAIRKRTNYAFETTLGGNTVPARLVAACKTHDVLMWFCGLTSPELHLERVRNRVRAGGHDIPEQKIRERYVNSLHNLIKLMPALADLRVFDNSTPAGVDGVVPDPLHVLSMQHGKLIYPLPDDTAALQLTPDWAKPLVAAAIGSQRTPKPAGKTRRKPGK